MIECPGDSTFAKYIEKLLNTIINLELRIIEARALVRERCRRESGSYWINKEASMTERMKWNDTDGLKYRSLLDVIVQASVSKDTKITCNIDEHITPLLQKISNLEQELKSVQQDL